MKLFEKRQIYKEKSKLSYPDISLATVKSKASKVSLSERGNSMRNIVLFNSGWLFVKEAADESDVWKQAGQAVTLPHTWNAADGQDGGDDYYRGKCWYVKKETKAELLEEAGIGKDKLDSDQAEIWLEFDGAAYTSEVYLNHKKVLSHEDGYSRFRVNLTRNLKGLAEEESLEIALSVDNSRSDRVYPQKADFTFYGGIYRDVKLVSIPKAHFALGYRGADGLKITPIVDLATHDTKVTVEAWMENAASESVHFMLKDATGSLVGEAEAQTEDGYAKAELVIEKAHLWDGTEDPYLYICQAELESGDTVSDCFGCRVFDFDPKEGFFLNGRSYPLRGVSRHQDRKSLGNALTKKEHREDMELIREIGANTIRLAHYQHAQDFYDLCDEYGMVVWAEIPFITMFMEKGEENTLDQMEDLIVQNYNHPSIAVWGLSNEITAATPVSDALLENHRKLNDLCHRLDPTRKTTMADVFMLETESPILEIPDINSYNLYFGWYVGDLEQNEEFFDEYHAKYPERVIGLSEYGADANPAFQAEKPEKGDYTEGYQALYHEHMAAMIEARPWLWATHVWNMFDFAADGRDEGGKHGENQKGLVTFDRTYKKDAFYLYKAYWNTKELFVHLCGKNYKNRECDETEVKVYSNYDEVSLYVDGKLFETKQAHRVFTFRIKNAGTQKIQAVAESGTGKVTDEMTITKVAEADSAYRMNGAAPVQNWFDKDEIDPACFSVYDKLGDLQADPKAGPIMAQMMAKASASRGEVAESVKDNPALKRMIARTTLISLLKQAGAGEEQVKQLNRILQGIPKSN